MNTKYVNTQAVPDRKYLDLQNRVKWHLSDFFERGQLKSEQLMAILYLLSFTENVRELEFFLAAFADSFPVLADFVKKKAGEAKTGFDLDIAALVQKLLQKDPLLAAKVAKASAAKDMDLPKLLALFPDIQKYL